MDAEEVKALMASYTAVLESAVTSGIAAAAKTSQSKSDGDKKPSIKEKDTLSLSDLDANQWYVFREHFETCVKVNKWDDDRAKDMLYLAMRDAAQTAINHIELDELATCLLYTSPSPRDGATSRMPSPA